MKMRPIGVFMVLGLVLGTGLAYAQNWWVEGGAIGPDDTIHLGWVNETSGNANLWTVSNDGSNVLSSVMHGAPGGTNSWLNEMYVRSNNTTIAYWQGITNATFWILSSSNTLLRTDVYPNPTDWNPGRAFLGTDSKIRLIWQRWSDKAISIWTIGTNGSVDTGTGVFIPPSGWEVGDWTHNSDIGSDGNVRLLWNDTSGNVSLWTVNSAGSVLNSTYWSAPSGWTCTNHNISVGTDNKTRIFWENPSNNALSIWVAATNGAVESSAYFLPPAGWQFHGGAVLGTSNNVGVAWGNGTQVCLWKLNNALSPIGSLILDASGGWSMELGQVDSAGKIHFLWINESTGAHSLWRFDVGWTNIEAVANYGPY